MSQTHSNISSRQSLQPTTMVSISYNEQCEVCGKILFVFASFRWLQCVSSRCPDFVQNSRYNGFQWRSCICEMKDGVTFHAVIISWITSPTLHTGENILYAKNVEHRPICIYNWRNYMFQRKGTRAIRETLVVSCARRHANKICGNETQKKYRKQSVRCVRAHGIVCSFLLFLLSRAIKIVSYRIITSVHIKRIETRNDWTWNAQLTHFPMLSPSLSLSASRTHFLIRSISFLWLCRASSDVKVSTEKMNKKMRFTARLEERATVILTL